MLRSIPVIALTIMPFILAIIFKRWPKLGDKLMEWINTPLPNYRKFEFWKERTMPVATSPVSDGDRRELKTAPPDGFVMVKRLTYGQSLVRQTMSTKMSIGGASSKEDFSGALDIDQEAIALYEFAHCVVDHNLTDASGRKLNFKNAADVRALDRAVGEEIGRIIDEINDVENSDDTKE